MPRNDGVQFKPSPIKIPSSSSSPISNQNPKFPFFKPNFACQSLSSSSRNPKFSVTHFFNSLKLPQNVRKFPFFLQKSLLGSSTLSVSQPSESRVTQSKEAVAVSRVSREGDERLLIKEVLVKGKDGKELDKELELEVLEALKASRPNSALSSREVQEDVHRIIDCGSFASCSPVVVDAKDGTKLVYEVEPNQELQGLVCEGANALPSKFIKDSFQNGYGKVVNVRRLGEVIDTINGWYVERGMFGMVSGVEILSGGILKLQVAEAEVNDVSIRFVDKEREPIAGKTKTETILRELSTKKGQIYSIKQGKRDVDTVMSMGIMEDVGILPQPAGETGKVDLVMNVVERVSGGFSAGGGISGGITNGPLSGLIGSLSYSHRNLFGKNHKVNISLERGQIDSIFRIGYKVPWIDGDGNRTRSSIMVQNSRSPGTVVHDQPDGHSLTINHVTAGVEVSRPLRPKWNGTAGVTFQRAGARDQNGTPLNMDFYSSPLTASGNSHDNTLLSKCEFNYTGDSALSAFFSMEQGVPILPGWLCFNRINSRARKIFRVGPANLLLSLSGGHVVGNFPPHEAFPIGGIDSVRGYEEGAVGSGRSYAVGCGEVSFPLYGPVDGALFADYGTDLRTGSSIPGNPAGARQKPGKGYGYGCGIRFDSPLGPLRLEYAFNDQRIGKFHFGVGYRS